MAKKKASLADITAQAMPDRSEEAPAVPSPVTPSRATTTVKRPHVSLYLDERVQRKIKQIALDMGRRPHDIYLEGVELILEKYIGKNIADITS